MKSFKTTNIQWDENASTLTVDGGVKGVAELKLPNPFLGQLTAAAKPDYAEINGGDRVYQIPYGQALDLR